MECTLGMIDMNPNVLLLLTVLDQPYPAPHMPVW
jgi:hypothetical protein